MIRWYMLIAITICFKLARGNSKGTHKGQEHWKASSKNTFNKSYYTDCVAIANAAEYFCGTHNVNVVGN